MTDRRIKPYTFRHFSQTANRNTHNQPCKFSQSLAAASEGRGKIARGERNEEGLRLGTCLLVAVVINPTGGKFNLSRPEIIPVSPAGGEREGGEEEEEEEERGGFRESSCEKVAVKGFLHGNSSA